jgi:hypothetical protein
MANQGKEYWNEILCAIKTGAAQTSCQRNNQSKREIMTKSKTVRVNLEDLHGKLSPELYSQVESQLKGSGEEVSDNQNQNQGVTEDLANLKPDVLREITVGTISGGEEVMDNQNQNQGKLDDLLKLKPDVLRRLRVALRSGEEVMDNQNQNQGSTNKEENAKPPTLSSATPK